MLMKTISTSSFRRYGAMLLRVIWTTILMAVLFWLYENYLSSRASRRQNTDFVSIPLLFFGVILVLATLSLYKLTMGLFGRVMIFEDLLRDKEIRVEKSTDDHGRTSETYYYYLYFEQIYGKYAKVIDVSRKTYSTARTGERYFVGIIHGKLSNRIYSVKTSELANAAKRAVVTNVRLLGQKAHWRWCAPEEKSVEAHTGVKRITPEQIVEDMYAYNGEARTEKSHSVSLILILVAIIAVSVAISYSRGTSFLKGLVSSVLFFVEVLIPISVIMLPIYLMERTSVKGIRHKKKLILERHYKVVLEEIAVTEDYDNGSVRYRDIHALMPIRLASGRAIDLKRSIFNDVRPGDKLYVVYLDSDNIHDDNDSIVAVYQEKLGKLDFGFDVEWAHGVE